MGKKEQKSNMGGWFYKDGKQTKNDHWLSRREETKTWVSTEGKMTSSQ